VPLIDERTNGVEQYFLENKPSSIQQDFEEFDKIVTLIRQLKMNEDIQWDLGDVEL
jgi:hypothetical protein